MDAVYLNDYLTNFLSKVIGLCVVALARLLLTKVKGSSTLRASLHHGPWSRTMEDGLYPWSDLMVQHPWFDFLKENQFTKPLDSWLGVDQMWIKRNDYAPKVNVLIFLIYVQKRHFWKKKFKLEHSLSSFVFIFSSLKNHFIRNFL